MKNYFKTIKSIKIIILLLSFIFTPNLTHSSPNNPINLYPLNQSYNVTLRGNKESVVYLEAKLNVENIDSLDNLKFTLPDNINPNFLEVYQNTSGITNSLNYYDGSLNNENIQNIPRYGTVIDSLKNIPIWEKLSFTKNGDWYQANLTARLNQNHNIKSMDFVIVYITKDYVNSFLGVNNFDFKTIKFDVGSNNVKVNLSVENSFIIKAKKRDIQYSQTPNTFNYDLNPNTRGSTNSQGIEQGLDNFINSNVSLNSDNTRQVGVLVSTELTQSSRSPLEFDLNLSQPKQIIDSTSNLGRDESVVIKGAYSNNWLLLNLSNIVIFIFSIAIILTLSILLYRKYGKNILKQYNDLKKYDQKNIAEKSNIDLKIEESNINTISDYNNNYISNTVFWRWSIIRPILLAMTITVLILIGRLTIEMSYSSSYDDHLIEVFTIILLSCGVYLSILIYLLPFRQKKFRKDGWDNFFRLVKTDILLLCIILIILFLIFI